MASRARYSHREGNRVAHAHSADAASPPIAGHIRDRAPQLCAERTYLPNLLKLGLWVPAPTN